MIPGIGPMEILILLAVALIIFGPKKLPQMGRSLGNGLREFKSSVTGEGASKPVAVEQAKEPADST